MGCTTLLAAMLPVQARDLVWVKNAALSDLWDASRVVVFQETNWNVVSGSGDPPFPQEEDNILFRTASTIDLNGARHVRNLVIETTGSLSLSGGALTLAGITRRNVAGAENNHAISIPLVFDVPTATVHVDGSGFLNLSGALTGQTLTKTGEAELVLTHPSVNLNRINVFGGSLRLASTPDVMRSYPRIDIGAGSSLIVDTPFRLPVLAGNLLSPAEVRLRNRVTLEADVIEGGLALTGVPGAIVQGALAAGARVSVASVTFSPTGRGLGSTIELGAGAELRLPGDLRRAPGSLVENYGVRTTANDAVIDTNGFLFQAGQLHGTGSATFLKRGAGTLEAVVTSLEGITLERGTLLLPDLTGLRGVEFAGTSATPPELRLSERETATTATALRIDSGAVIDVERAVARATTTAAVSGAGVLYKRGFGTLALHGPGSGFTGSMLIEDGELEFATTSAARPLALIVAGGTLRLARADTIDPSTQLSLFSGALHLDAANPLRHFTYAQGILGAHGGILLTPGGAGYTHVTAGAATDVLSLPISLVRLPGEAAGIVNFTIGADETLVLTNPVFAPETGLRKRGPGTLLLAADNPALVGNVHLDDGTLGVASPHALDYTRNAGLRFSGGVLRLDVDGVRLPAMELLGTGARMIDLNGRSGRNGQPITGDAGLNLAGAGQFGLLGHNTFSGVLRIADGAAALVESNTALGSLATPVILDDGRLAPLDALFLPDTRDILLGPGGGTFDVGAGKSLVLNATTAGPGKMTLTGAGATVLNAVSQHTGGTAIRGASVEIGRAEALGSGPVVLSDGAWLRLQGSVPLNLGQSLAIEGSATIEAVSTATHRFNARLGGVGRLAKAGAGTLALGGGSDELDIDILHGTLTIEVEGLGQVLGDVRIDAGATLHVDEGAGSGGLTVQGTTSLHGGSIRADAFALVLAGDLGGTGTLFGASVTNLYLGTIDIENRESLFTADALAQSATHANLTLVGGAHTLAFGSRLVLDIAPDAHDQILLRDGASLALGGVVELRFAGKYDGLANRSFTLFDGGRLNPVSMMLEASGLPGGLVFDGSELFTTGVLTVRPVPLPTPVLLMLSGIVVLRAAGRRHVRLAASRTV